MRIESYFTYIVLGRSDGLTEPGSDVRVYVKSRLWNTMWQRGWRKRPWNGIRYVLKTIGYAEPILQLPRGRYYNKHKTDFVNWFDCILFVYRFYLNFRCCSKFSKTISLKASNKSVSMDVVKRNSWTTSTIQEDNNYSSFRLAQNLKTF